MCSDEIRALRLAGTRERIPFVFGFAIDGTRPGPLIVEIKSSPLRPALCEAVAKALDSYNGILLCGIV
jgi:hypothetical protein